MSADRQRDRQKDAGDFIICPMLSYGNGSDNFPAQFVTMPRSAWREVLLLQRVKCVRARRCQCSSTEYRVRALSAAKPI